MNIWEPFNPIAYFSHTILGFLGVIGALVSLSVIKGSTRHKKSGWIFVVSAFIAAVTALVFSFTEFSGAAIASCIMTFSSLGAAILALKSKTNSVKVGELLTTSLMGLVFLFLMLGTVMSLQGGVWLPPLLYSLFPLGLLVGDIRFLRLNETERQIHRIPRHLSRMAFTFAIAVHAPIVSFSDELGIHPALAFFGPFIIWPAIVIIFKRRNKLAA